MRPDNPEFRWKVCLPEYTIRCRNATCWRPRNLDRPKRTQILDKNKEIEINSKFQQIVVFD